MYEKEVEEELRRWQRKMKKRPSRLSSKTKEWQNKINDRLPGVYHQTATICVQKTIEAVLAGNTFVTKEPEEKPMTLKECDDEVRRLFQLYRRTAVFEGIGTGAGGVLLGLSDFPLLLSIKFKALFATAAAYGYSPKEESERQLILLIFQLAYSSGDDRAELLEAISDHLEQRLLATDWQALQLRYRDYIDVPKMFQLIPGFGAVVGGAVNHTLLEKLEETAMNVYRMRWLNRLNTQ
ncbi:MULTISPECIES: EcsC family protein [Shouchella]|uniref:EcsC family protein n=2 Tax=Shouchella TaxID=2893057 RepID=A0A268NXF7_SHOCL|nr:EcsC family protein [Shouchella clausii]PAE88186.1 hypothetical protein CHH72_15190 [Shouchella clausii]